MGGYCFVCPTAPARVFYDGRCKLCCACVEWLRRRLPVGRVEFVDTSLADRVTENSASIACASCEVDALRVQTPEGAWLEGADAVRELARWAGWGRWVGWTGWPGLRWVARAFYRWVAFHRYTLSKWF